MRKMLFALAIGAALAYLFDPQLGAKRRDGLKSKLDRSGSKAPAPVEAVDVLVFDERTPMAAGLS